MKRTLSTAIIVSFLLLGTGAASAFVLSGTVAGGGTRTRTDPTPVGRTTLLKMFDLSFHPSIWGWGNHIEGIGVLSETPNLRSTWIQFRDRNADDAYSYGVDQHVVTLSPDLVRRVVIENSASDARCHNRGNCVIPAVELNRPSANHVFVLRGFHARFRNTDHQLKHLTIIEHNAKLYLSFHDRNWDDPIRFEVEFAWVPPAMVRETGDSWGRNATFNDSQTEGVAGVRVLSGFELEFVDDDHEIVWVSVKANDVSFEENDQGSVEVVFDGQNGNKRFNWQVKWAVFN